jgi:hypothetical protein
MIIISLVLGAVGLSFCWLGYGVIGRSSGSVAGVLTGLFMFLLGLAFLAAGVFLHGFIPAFV